MSLQEHGQLTITFGTKAKGKRFEELLETNPSYVKWCCEHLSDSTKLDHRIFLRYVERVINQAEEIAAIEKALEEPTDGLRHPSGGRTIMRAGSKAKAVPRPKATASDEDDRWDMISEPSAAIQTEVNALNQRMTHMETMLQQLVHHLSTQSSPPNAS